MKTSNEEILKVYSQNVEKIKMFHKEQLKYDKAILFKMTENQIRDCKNQIEKDHVIEKYKSLIFKLEDKSNEATKQSLKQEGVKFICALKANIVLLENDFARNAYFDSILEEIELLKEIKNTGIHKVEAKDVEISSDTEELRDLLAEIKGWL